MENNYTIISIKEVQNLFKKPVSKSTASRWMNECRDALNKPHPQILTLDEFCRYFGLKTEN